MSAASILRADRPSQYGRAFACSAVVLAVFAAALLAHVCIDVVGDSFLAHDSYEDIAHGSRVAAFAGVLFVFAGLSIRLLCAGLERAGGAGTTLRRMLEPIVGRSPWRFIALVVAASPVMLAGMEALDTLLGGGRLGDLGDLFGGSVALGLGILLPAAALSAVLVWATLRAVAESHRAIARALSVFFSVWRAPSGAGLLGSLWGAIAPPRSASPPAHRAGTRAPPLLLT